MSQQDKKMWDRDPAVIVTPSAGRAKAKWLVWRAYCRDLKEKAPIIAPCDLCGIELTLPKDVFSSEIFQYELLEFALEVFYCSDEHLKEAREIETIHGMPYPMWRLLAVMNDALLTSFAGLLIPEGGVQ